MKSKAYACGVSDIVTLDALIPYTTCYIYVASAGDIVFLNTNGQNQFFSNAGVGYHPLRAIRVLSSGIVNGVARTTSATDMTYLASID